MVIEVDGSVAAKLACLGRILADDEGAAALGIDDLAQVAHAVGVGDDDGFGHAAHGGEVGMVHLVHLLEAVEDVQVVGLLLDDVVEVVGAVTEQHDRDVAVAQLVDELHGLGDVVLFLETPLVEHEALGQVILLAQDVVHVLGHGIVTAVVEAGVHDIDVVGVNVVVVDDDLAVDLVEGNHTLGKLAGLAGAALHEHALNPAVLAAVERVGHGEYRGEVAAVES